MTHRRAPLALLALLLLLAGAVWADEEDDSNPHRMAGPDDDSSCSFCHEEDMSLSQSPLETCLVCHSATEHAGSVEHLRVKVAAPSAPHPTPAAEAEAAHLPLTDDGEMWCGTCHLFHDPRVNEDVLLSESWLPPTTGLSGAVRAAVASRWMELAEKYDQKPPVASFATQGTTWLRLPVSNGALCLECHRGLKK